MKIPVSAIIPTYNRSRPLKTALETISTQEIQFKEIIVIDASDNNETEELCRKGVDGLEGTLIYQRAQVKGAATQRNEGVVNASQPFIAFMDDDVYLEDQCIPRLWKCFEENDSVGGVSAMIINQKYQPLGKFTRFMCELLSEKKYESYAGRCIGPAWNFLPSDDATLPEYVQVDWLNLGLTIYRKGALPTPPFQKHFKGYSMMEDLTLSLLVGNSWRLYNARTAKIFHDSQPGDYKRDFFKMQKMSFVNRYFIMRNVLGKSARITLSQIFILELFQFFSLFKKNDIVKKGPLFLWAKVQAFIEINKSGSK
jgi:glycosyltransferase involved in cell wall biosynthesis